MKLRELLAELKHYEEMGMLDEEVYITVRFDSSGELITDNEMSQAIETTEPGDGIESIYILGKIA